MPVRVLAAEDNPEIAKSLLERFPTDYVVVLVEKAEDVLVELGRGTFDIIITDNDTNSNMSGLQVIETIRNHPFWEEICNIPIVMQSGDEMEAEVKALKATFLHKPYSKTKLLQAVIDEMASKTGSFIHY